MSNDERAQPRVRLSGARERDSTSHCGTARTKARSTKLTTVNVFLSITPGSEPSSSRKTR